VLDELEQAKLIEQRDGPSDGGQPPKVFSIVSGVLDLLPLATIDHIDDLR
jgi:hypothetical protein